ncbi:hypothetical protein AAFF_G00277290, partial [Aldrovandia affinis]
MEEGGVRDEGELCKEQGKESDEQRKGDVAEQHPQTDRGQKNEGNSEFRHQEGEEMSTLVTSFLLKQPRVLIRRLEITDLSVPVSSPPHPVSSTRGQGVRSPWRRHELSPVRTPQSSRQKGQVVTRKNKAVSQLERPLALLPASSASRIHAEASCSSPVIS